MFSFFKTRQVRFLGMAGIVFTYEGVEYFIDSELLTGDKYGIAIFTDTLRRKDSSEIVGGELKNATLTFLLDYLMKREKLRVELFPK